MLHTKNILLCHTLTAKIEGSVTERGYIYVHVSERFLSIAVFNCAPVKN